MRYRLSVIVLTILGFFCKCLAVPIRSSPQSESVSGTKPQIHRLHTPAGFVEHLVNPPQNDLNIQVSTDFSSPPMPSFYCIASRQPSLVTPSPSQVDEPSQSPSSVPSRQSVLPFDVQMAPARQDHFYQLWRRKDLDTQTRIFVVLEILGGLIGTAFLILCGRSIRHYYRMPRRNLASEHIDRFNLEKELADLEEARLRVNSPTRTSTSCPPPPYREAPLYEEAVKEVLPAPLNERRGS